MNFAALMGVTERIPWLPALTYALPTLNKRKLIRMNNKEFSITYLSSVEHCYLWQGIFA